MRRAAYIKTKGQKNAKKLIKKLLCTNKSDWTPRLILEKLFWGVVYFSGLVLVALSCNDLYNQYQQNNIAKIDIGVRNESITLPSPTVCLPFFPEQEKKQSYYNDNDETDEWKEKLAYVDDLNNFFGNKSWAEIQNDDWTVPMIIIAQNYLSVIYETESLNEKSSSSPFQKLLGTQDNISLAIIESFIPKMIEWNVTLPEFRDEFSRQFQLIYPITVNCSDCDPYGTITQEMVFVNKIQVCFRLGFENVLFRLNTALMLDIENIYVACPHALKNTSNLCDVGFPPVTVDLTGQARAGSFYREFDNIYSAFIFERSSYRDRFRLNSEFQRKLRLEVNPSIQYIALPVVNSMCPADGTKEVCRGKCRNAIIQKKCSCSAITVPTQSQSSPLVECMFGQYERCMMNFTGTEDAECIEKCLDSCISWKYDVKPSSGDLPRGFGQDYHYYIEFIITTTDYIVTTESFQWTLVAIIGVIGGAVGFWLGLDIATIFYSIITAPLLLLKRNFSNQVNSTQEAVIESATTEDALSDQKLFDQSWDIKDPLFVIWAMQKLIWSTVFIAGAVLTILMFVQLIQQYQQGGTQTNINIILNNTIRIPDAALCRGAGGMPYYVPNADPLIHEKGYVQSELQNYMNQPNMNKETFLGTETWPPTMTFMAYVYLFTLSTIIEEDTPPYVPFSDEQLVLNLTRNILLNFSVSNEELQQKLAIEYMKFEKMTTSCYSSTANIQVQILPTKATFETVRAKKYSGAPLWLCLHLPLSNFEYRSTNDICRLTHDDVSHSKMYFIMKSSTSSYRYFYSSDFDFDDRTMTNLSLAFTTIFKNFLNCNNTYTSIWDCWDKCRTEIAERACPKCTISATSMTAVECTMDEYVNCLKAVSFETKCTDQCKLASCTISNPLIFASNQALDPYVAELNIRLEEFNYILMSQQWAMTESDFFANSGGLIGFWLGIDCTFFISIIFTPLMLLVGALLKKITKGTDADQEETNMERFFLLKMAKILRIDTIQLPKLFIMKALFERIFWFVINIVFSAITLKMCINFHQQYLSTPIGFSYKDINNESYTIPQVTLCLPWVAPATSTPNTTDEDFEYITDLPVLEMKQLIVITNSTWPNSLLQISFQYLGFMEGYKVMDRVDLKNMWGDTLLRFLNTTRTLDIFDKNLELLKITSDELMQKFGLQMLRRYSVNVKKWIVEANGLTNAKLMTINQTTFVSSTTICFFLPHETTSFGSVADYFTIQSLLPAFDDYFGFNSTCSFQFDFAYSVSLDLLGRQTGSPTDDFVLRFKYFYENWAYSIAVKEVIRVLPEVNGVRRCSDTTTIDVCMDECQVDAIKQQCNCTPGSDGTNLGRNVCSWSIFKNCLPHFSLLNASNCMDKCLPTCEQVRYKWDTDTASTSEAWETMKSTACHLGEPFIGMASFQYRMYAEQLQWSFYSYTAGLGGTLGILLGIDVILSIEYLFTFANWLFSFFGWCCTLSKKKTIETQQNVDNELKIESSRITMRKSKIIVVRSTAIAV